MEDWLKKEISNFDLMPQKGLWDRIVLNTEPIVAKKSALPRFVLTVLGVFLALLCVNVLPPKCVNKQKTPHTKNFKNYTNNSELFKKKEIASYFRNNLTKHQTQASDNDKNQPIQTLFQTKKNLLSKKDLLVKCNLDRKSGLNLSTPILQLAHHLKINQAQTSILKQGTLQKPHLQVNYKFAKQNRAAPTARTNHKLEGLVFWNIRERISVGMGMGLQRSKWSTAVGKKLNTKRYEKGINNQGSTNEESDFFVDGDTVFVNEGTYQATQETNESSYWDNNFYAKDGDVLSIKENTLWLFSTPIRLRYDVFRKKEWVFRVAGTAIPQIIFNQKSLANHNELNVWVEDNQTFNKVNLAFEGSIEVEKRINKRAFNVQFSIGFNPLKKQNIYKKELPKHSINGSIGLGYLFGG